MLSIVVNTRNDNHGGGLIHRLEVFVECLADYREQLSWDLELVLVEWNAPDDFEPIYELVEFPPDWTRIYRVPPKLHNQFENSDVVPFFFHLAHNVGIRRAQGDWILITSQDLVFSELLARWLALENFNPSAYYRALRVDSTIEIVPKETAPKRAELLADQAFRVRPPKHPGRIYTKACGDFTMLRRSDWHRLRGGFPEWGLFGIYLDGIVVHSAYATGLRQVVLDDRRCVYHIHHHSQGNDIKRSFPHFDYDAGYLPLVKGMVDRMEPLIVNGEDWGLGDCEEVQLAPNVWRLEGEKRERGVPLPDNVWAKHKR
jgi:hypothetical protein